MVPLLVVQAGCLALGIPLSYHVMCFEKIQQRRGVLERNPALTCWGAGLGTTWFVLSVMFSLRLQLSAPLVRLQWASVNIHVWSPITFRACQHLLIRRRTENSSDRSFCSNNLVRRPPQQVVSQLNKRTFKFWGAFALQHLWVEVLLHYLAPAHYLAIIHTFGTNLILLVAALFVFLRTPKKPDPLHLRKDLRICLYSWAGFFGLVLPLSMFGRQEQALYVSACLALIIFSIMVVNPVYLSGFDKRGRRIVQRHNDLQAYRKTLGERVTVKALTDKEFQKELLSEIFRDPNATEKLHALARRDFQPENSCFLEAAHLFHRIASEVAAACRGQKMREEWLQSLRVFSIEGFAGLGTSPDSVDCGSNRPGVAGGNQQPTLNRYRLQSVSSTNQNPPFLQLQEMLGKAYDKLLQEFVMPGSPKELNISTALRDSLLSFSYQIDGAELAAAAIVSTSPRKTVVSSVVRVGSSRSSSSSKEATSSSFMAAISPMPVPSKALPPLVLTPPNHPRSSTSSSHKFSLFAPHTFQLPSSLKPNYSRKVTRRQPAASIFQASLQQRAVTGGKDSDQAPKTAPAATGRMSETHRVTERSSQLRMVVTPGRGMPPLEKKEAKEQRSELSFSAGNGGQRTTGTYFKAARSRLSSLLSGTTPSHEFLQLGQEQNEGLFATSSASSKPPLQQGGDADRPPQVKEKGGGKEAPGPFSPGAARGALRLAEAEVAGLLFRNMDVSCRGRTPEALKEVLLLAELDGALAGCGVQRVRKGGAAGHRAAAIAPAPVAQGIALAAPSSAVVAPAPPGWWDGPC